MLRKRSRAVDNLSLPKQRPVTMKLSYRDNISVLIRPANVAQGWKTSFLY